MPDAATPPGGTSAPPASTAAEELRGAWEGFRKGAMVSCPNDGAAVALSVDAAFGVYRFVCTRCGSATPWFESAPGGIRLRSARDD